MLEPDVEPLASSFGRSSKVVLFLLSQTVSIALRVRYRRTTEQPTSNVMPSHCLDLVLFLHI
jgi:hypothetical protein